MLHFYMLLAVAAGAALSIQVGVNNALRAGLGSSPVLAALVSFAIGWICLMGYALATRTPWPSMQVASSLPVWMWLGGVLGAYYVASTISAAPHLGAANLISIVVAAQWLTSLVLDHFGALGFARHGINAWRVLGALLLVAGATLVVRN